MEDARALVNEYDELYETMAASRNTADMKNFGDAERKIFRSLAHHHPDIAEKWLTMLKAGKWNNYLSQSEAVRIASDLINQNGSKGPHWDYDMFCEAVRSFGGRLDDPPYYNSYALWVVANMRYSDNAVSASEYVPKDQMPKFFYNVAVEQLKDVDHPRFVREHYDL